MDNNVLSHHGIKGMKWGIRRYQNSDGSYTAAGKKRRDSMSDDARDAREISKKKISQMSNAELKKINERTRLEQEYSRLNPGTVQKGWKTVAAAAGVMGTALAVYNNGGQIITLGKKAGNKIVDAVGNMVMTDLLKNGIM